MSDLREPPAGTRAALVASGPPVARLYPGAIDEHRPSTYARDAGTWLAFGLLLQFGFLQASLGAVVPYLRRELDVGYTVGSLHLAAFAGASVVAGVASGRLEAALRRRGLVVAGVSGMAAGAVVLALAPVLAATLLGSFVMGLGGMLTLVGVHAALADAHGERRAVAIGEGNVAASLGSLSVPLAVSAAEGAGLSWRLALAFGAAAGALLAWRVRAAGVREAGVVAAAGRGGRLPAPSRVAVALVFLVVCAEWSVAFWGATFADDAVGLSTDAAVGLSSAFFAAMLTGRLAGSALARRIGAEPLLAGAIVVALAGFPLLWTAHAAITAGLGLVLVGLGIGNLFPLSVSLAIAASPGRTTQASSRAMTAGSAAVLCAPLVLGRVADAGGLRTAFGLVPVFLALAGTTLVLLARRPAPVAGPARAGGARPGGRSETAS